MKDLCIITFTAQADLYLTSEWQLFVFSLMRVIVVSGVVCTLVEDPWL
jgi:hypothetical protein